MPTFIGTWEGVSKVESTSGVPECIAPFWRLGFTDRIVADIQPFPAAPGFGPGSNIDLHLTQETSEEVHLRVGWSESMITATNWPFDEFDCAIMPALCPPFSHFQLRSSEWGCVGTPPEVWIVHAGLSATFDSSQSRMQGVLEIEYAHRAGDIRGAGAYRDATVVKRIALEKSPQ